MAINSRKKKVVSNTTGPQTRQQRRHSHRWNIKSQYSVESWLRTGGLNGRSPYRKSLWPKDKTAGAHNNCQAPR